jgi:protein-disulfide isomerase
MEQDTVKGSINWIHIVAYGLSAILIILIAVKLFQHFSTSKSKVQIEQLHQKPLDIVFGADTANLSIFMYSSYSCSYCALFFSDVSPEIKEEYFDTGKVKLIMRLTVKTNDIDLKNSLKTAVCINKYGNFKYLHELLINDSKIVYTDAFRSMIDEFIEKDNLVAECILGGEADDYLLENIKDFESMDLRGTPTFIIDNKIYSGYRNADQFKKIILNHLKSQ